MSCSVFKEFPESTDNHLVVVINKNGNVSVDQSELHDFLVNKDSTKTSTTVSVVRLASPTPSIEQELNEQEELEKELAREFNASGDESVDDGKKEEVVKVPNVNVIVEKYYNAEEAKQFASEILSAAGITDPKQVVKDLAHQRRAVVNDHCYTPLTSPSQRRSESRRSTPVQTPKKLDVVKDKAKPVPSTTQPKKTDASDDEEEVSDEEVDESDSENTYYSPSENENDRDSDLDFNVNDRPPRGRKVNRSKASRNKRAKGAAKVIKKRPSIVDEDKSEEATTSSGKRKSAKRRSTSTNKTPTASSTKIVTAVSKVPSLMKANTELKKDTPIATTSTTIGASDPPLPALTPITSKALPQKKDKKQPAHVDAYLNNMSSLFSTPDIIKKVGNDARASPSTSSQSIAAAPPTPSNKNFFMPLNPGSIKNPQQLPAQISVQTHTATPELDLIDSYVRDIVQEELKQNAPPSIPNIVKILENTESVLGDVINPTQSASTSGTLLDDSGMLGLGNAEDCLPDEILFMKLVEDKKIQEVIDKQVLEEKATISTIPVDLPPVSATITKPDSTLKGPVHIDASKSEKKNDSLKGNASVTTTPVQAKEPIKIVRSDGRVILLPPLEAPTTRAKRRALTQSFDTAAKNEPATTTPKSSKVQPKVVEEVKEKEKARRSSTTKKPAETPKAKAIVPESTTVEKPDDDDDYDDEDDAGGSNNAEDDPYRLWCICRQPHNNRFMICCDKCEDWFHGKCVNVTKAMGTEMEEQGIEWVCPNCVKKYPGKKPPERKSSTSKSSSLNSSLRSCIVCKNQARPNSIYCSDDCIRRHAQTTASNVSSSQIDSLNTSDKSKKPTPAKSVPKAEYIVTKNNRVIVFENDSGRVLTGSTAPTPDKLKQWLLDNPTFEVVKPGSKHAQFIKVKQEQLNRERQNSQNAHQADKAKTGVQRTQQQQQQQQKIQTTLKIGPSKQVMIVNPSKKSAGTASTTPQQLPTKVVSKAQKLVPAPQSSPKPTSPVKQSPVSKSAPKPTTPKTPAPRLSNPNKRKSDPKSDTKSSETKDETSSETIRVTVHRHLKEAISQRMSEVTEGKHAKLTADEIDSFASDTEREIYNLFSKDIGAKYRAKYRSLVFNIKDRKNDSLFQKICEKTIKPNQFVRMSAEELASQQLAQWRENENKHQLEMIKKSELDLLAASKSYVLKTHKGEEVIENKVTDRLTLDPSISVEDVVSILNNSTVSSTSETVEHVSPVKDQRIDTRFDKYLSVDSSGSGKMGSSSKKKDGHRSRSRDRSQDKHDRKSSSSKHKRKRSRERRSRSRERRGGDKGADEKNRDKDRDRDSKKKDDKEKREREKHKATESKGGDQKKPAVKVKEPPKPIKKEDNFNIIDEILKAESTFARVKQVEDTKKTEISSASKTVPLPSETSVEQKLKAPPSSESDQEPSSTVTIPTPPEYLFDQQLNDAESALWVGQITMIDTATFQISVHGVSGDCDSIRKELPTELDIVGRIAPDTVWEYVDKIKKSKEILLVRLSAATKDDTDAYDVLYKYLHTRKRLGVIKTASRRIKDFYIFPLAAHKSLPSVLQSIGGQGFESGRPDLLLGIIVKTTLAVTKRAMPPSIPPIASKVPRLADALIVKPRIAEERYTPPSSPKTLPKSTLLEIPITIEDGDEPYSPGGSDDEIPFQSSKTIPPATIQSSSLYAQLEDDELQRKMDEVNRQIKAQEMEIAGMLDTEVANVDEPYSPTSSMSTSVKPTTIPALANISIPSNLQEILNSIKQSSLPSTDQSMSTQSATATSSILDDDEEYNPVPMDAEYNPSADYIPMKTLSMKHFQSASMDTMQSTSKEPSKLAQLTEEELLSMVPDDIDLPPVTSFKKQSTESATRMSNYDMFEPPPPGEEEYVP